MILNCRKIIGGMINELLRPLNLEVRSIRHGSMDIEKEKKVMYPKLSFFSTISYFAT